MLNALRLLLALASISLTGCVAFQKRPDLRPARFDFALIGDVPYTDDQVTNFFPRMIGALNRERLAFVVHDGDIKAGATPCTDELFEQRARQFNTFRHPLVLIPGDNEWSDCARTNAATPANRLEKLRELFFAGDESLGQRKMKLERQSNDPKFHSFRENVRWVKGNVLFAGLNVPGAANNVSQPEFATRNSANIAWLKAAFAAAKRDERRGIMIIIQANPFPERGSTNRVGAGFREMLSVLEQETITFGNPVVLVHGDSHYFRIDKPLSGTKSRRRLENFTRVETFGNPDVHWLRVTVDPADPNVFTFRQELVRDNLVDHRKPAPPPK
jgi:hypothetical protein